MSISHNVTLVKTLTLLYINKETTIKSKTIYSLEIKVKSDPKLSKDMGDIGYTNLNKNIGLQHKVLKT